MNSKLARTVLSVWSWFVIGVLVIVWTPLVGLTRLVTMPFDKGAYAAGYLFRKLTVVHQKLTPLWRFTVSGTLPDDMRNPYVVVSNHESFVDILLISHLPTEMKWMSKVEMLKIPLVGWMMRWAKDIPLNRRSSSSGAAALAASRDRLEKKVSVMIFPEGTRSESGELRKFRAGAFNLAIDTQLPILPLAVYGTRDALRKNDWRLGNARAEVRVLEPVSTKGMTRADVAELRDRVRDMIIAARDDLRREFGHEDVPAAADAALADLYGSGADADDVVDPADAARADDAARD